MGCCSCYLRYLFRVLGLLIALLLRCDLERFIVLWLQVIGLCDCFALLDAGLVYLMLRCCYVGCFVLVYCIAVVVRFCLCVLIVVLFIA